eukprot:gene3318-3640_t
MLAVTGEDLQEYALEVLEVIGEATVPTKPGEVVAIVFSEAAAGFVGGFASRAVGFALGDQALNRDKSFIQSSTVGTYFGIRSAVTSASSFLGLPSPVARVVASIFASLAAEILKIEGRKTKSHFNSTLCNDEKKSEFEFLEEQLEEEIEEIFGQKQQQQNNNNNNNENNMMMKKKPLVSGAEVMQDITKWVTYDLILPPQTADHIPLLTAAWFGALSGLTAYAVLEAFNRKIAFPSDPTGERWIKYSQAGIEGAALFASYEGSLTFLETSTAPELRAVLVQDFTELSAFFFPQ